MKHITRSSFFWIIFSIASIASIHFSIKYFSSAFPIIHLDLKMNRSQALEHAAKIAQQFNLGPQNYHQAASFETDNDVQIFVELEAGGKKAFSDMIKDHLYTPYTWHIRHFKEFEKNETTIIFKPDGTPYGFAQTISDNIPGAALTNTQAITIAGKSAIDWNIPLHEFILIEESQEKKASGRVDHTFTYERPNITIGKGYYRLQIVVSGGQTTKIFHYILIPEAFKLRYAHMRSANDSIASGANMAMLILYLFGGCIVGIFLLARKRFILYKTALLWAGVIALLQTLTTINELPLAWMHYDTSLSENVFIIQFIIQLFLQFFSTFCFYGVAIVAAESLTRAAFGQQPRLWNTWSTNMASSLTVWGRTIAGYIIVPLEIAFGISFYIITTTYYNWWIPSNTIMDPNILAHYFPWLSSIALSLGAGFMEECLFRAIPIAGCALIGKRFGNQKKWIIVGFIIQAIIFGACHANYPAQPAYARVVELVFFSTISGLIYLRFGLIPIIISHVVYDIFWFALPLFVSHSSDALFNQCMVLSCALIPLLIIIRARLTSGHWYTPSDNDLNHSWQPTIVEEKETPEPEIHYAANPLNKKQTYTAIIAGMIGITLWISTQQFHQDAQPISINRNELEQTALHILKEQDAVLDNSWTFLPTILGDFKNNSDIQLQHEFIWRCGGKDMYHQLLGSYLTPPNWSIRFASWNSPIADRAHEYQMLTKTINNAYRFRHELPQALAGKTVSEADARTIAHQAIARLFNIDAATLKEISAAAIKHPERKDWTFTFADTQNYTLKTGQARISIEIAGNNVIDGYRFIHVPEEWEREQYNTKKIVKIISLICTLLLYLLLSLGTIAAFRRHKSINLFTKKTLYLWISLLLFYAANIANIYPTIIASFKASEPFKHQLFMAFGILCLFAFFKSGALSLIISQVNRWKKQYIPLPHIQSYAIGLSMGAVMSGIMSAVKLYSPCLQPVWAQYNALATYLPWLYISLEGISSLITMTILLFLLCIIVNHVKNQLFKNQLMLIACFMVIGILLTNISDIENIPFWLASGSILGILLYAIYYAFAQYDYAIIPAAVGTCIITQLLRQAIFNAYPGAFVSNIIACIIIALLAFWWNFSIGRHNEVKI